MQGRVRPRHLASVDDPTPPETRYGRCKWAWNLRQRGIVMTPEQAPYSDSAGDRREDDDPIECHHALKNKACEHVAVSRRYYLPEVLDSY